jgi:hypothetical protein
LMNTKDHPLLLEPMHLVSSGATQDSLQPTGLRPGERGPKSIESRV